MVKRDVEKDILDAAARCFYADGITATGVDRLAEEADVSKRTIYQHFGSKEGVVTAYLDRREAQWRARLGEELDPEAPLEETLLTYLSVYMVWGDPDAARGCAFINASAEFADPDHPGLAIVRASLDHVIADLEAILLRSGVDDARGRAEELAMVFVGSLGTLGMRRDRRVKAIAERLVRRLLAHADLAPPTPAQS